MEERDPRLLIEIQKMTLCQGTVMIKGFQLFKNLLEFLTG